MRDRSSKRPADPNQLAKLVVDIATDGPASGPKLSLGSGKNAAAVALGRLGGKKGGAARAASLTAEQRREMAVRAATARWAKKDDR